jgi:vacuolar-type H+-ATPase subunit I/STV1
VSDPDLEELRQQTQRTDRLAEPSAGAEGNDDLLEDLVDALDAIYSGEQAKTFAARDESVTALLSTLDDREDDLEAVGTSLQRELDRDIDSGALDRSEIVRLAVRLGLREAAPEYLDLLADASGEYARRNV